MSRRPDAHGSRHLPVLLDELLELLGLQPGVCVVDCTIGGGGHALAVLERIGPTGKLIGLDRDPEMLRRAEQRLQSPNVQLVHANFASVRAVLDALDVGRVDAVYADLGVASDQLEAADRGFGFRTAGPLDMRFDPTAPGPTAAELVNRCSERELAELIRRYGEERYARRIARAIVRTRQRKRITRADELAEIVRQAVPRHYEHGRLDPATRTFQALRIAVNHELDALQSLLQQLPSILRPGGHAALISFHSLEDRLVKRAFADRERWERLTRKPIRPSAEEVARNPRARSARLRAARLLKPLDRCTAPSR